MASMCKLSTASYGQALASSNLSSCLLGLVMVTFLVLSMPAPSLSASIAKNTIHRPTGLTPFQGLREAGSSHSNFGGLSPGNTAVNDVSTNAGGRMPTPGQNGLNRVDNGQKIGKNSVPNATIPHSESQPHVDVRDVIVNRNRNATTAPEDPTEGTPTDVGHVIYDKSQWKSKEVCELRRKAFEITRPGCESQHVELGWCKGACNNWAKLLHQTASRSPAWSSRLRCCRVRDMETVTVRLNCQGGEVQDVRLASAKVCKCTSRERSF
eukprot:scpid64653/ scgid7757/ 